MSRWVGGWLDGYVIDEWVVRWQGGSLDGETDDRADHWMEGQMAGGLLMDRCWWISE